MHELFESGQKFLEQCGSLLDKNAAETFFFLTNAKNMGVCDNGDFSLRVTHCGKNLLMLKHLQYPALLWGDLSLCTQLADVLVQNKLKFDKLLCEKSLGETFLEKYREAGGEEFVVGLEMQYMVCDKMTSFNSSVTSVADAHDLDSIAQLLQEFFAEALHESLTIEECLHRAHNYLGRMVVAKVDGKIVSVAMCTENIAGTCRISGVYTLPQFRGKGYARQNVATITNRIVQQGCVATLFADCKNSVSTGLYRSLGFELRSVQVEFRKAN